jgi:hypothetical protein
VPIVLKSGIFNLLEPSGPVKACNGIALPSPLQQQFPQQVCSAQCGWFWWLFNFELSSMFFRYCLSDFEMIRITIINKR